jgi:putative phage-type endonuclease
MIEQGSPEWQILRVGKVTASRLTDVLATIKDGEAATRRTYRTQLVAERLTGKKEESYSSEAMRWGVDQEPFARAAYEIATSSFVDQVAFVDHPTIEMFGCSPDGLVGDNGLIEIKCPNTTTHLSYLEADKPPKQYMAQMMAQMSCTGRDWCDFVSFDPRLPSGLQLFITRVERDDKYIALMEAEVQKFIQEVSITVAKLKEKANGNQV